MKLKQLFCRHKTIIAIGMYEKRLPTISSSDPNIHVVFRCDKCDKEFECHGSKMHFLMKHHKKNIDMRSIVDHKLWGQWW